LEGFPHGNKFDRISLVRLSIPKTYYLIDSTNNSFTLDEGGLIATVFITEGNYGLKTLETELALQLNTASPSAWTYTCTGDERTGKYTFTVTGNGGVQPVITLSEEIAGILGFAIGSTAFVADTVTGVNVVRLQKTDGILVWTDLCAENEGVLSEVFGSSPDFDHISYRQDNVVYTGRHLNTKSSSRATFRVLTYEKPRQVLNLNGHHVHMVIALWTRNPLDDFLLRDRQIDVFKKRKRVDEGTAILTELRKMAKSLQNGLSK